MRVLDLGTGSGCLLIATLIGRVADEKKLNNADDKHMLDDVDDKTKCNTDAEGLENVGKLENRNRLESLEEHFKLDVHVGKLENRDKLENLVNDAEGKGEAGDYSSNAHCREEGEGEASSAASCVYGVGVDISREAIALSEQNAKVLGCSLVLSLSLFLTHTTRHTPHITNTKTQHACSGTCAPSKCQAQTNTVSS